MTLKYLLRTHLQRHLFLLPLISSLSSNSFALSLDGTGHYAVKPETATNPGSSTKHGFYQVIEHSFLLLGEARFHDRSSFFFDVSLFPNQSYLGDDFTSRGCDEADAGTCAPNSLEPRYKDYQPQVRKAYVRYGFDYFIVEAGRRGRDWALGLMHNSGNQPFSRQASIYDGVTFSTSLQKLQTLGFSFGYDKIAETGAVIGQGRKADINGPANRWDDVDQVFFSIEYDDRKINAGSAFTKQVGIYAAKITSADNFAKGGANTDLTPLDLYVAADYYNLRFENEILMYMGKTADPNATYLGGARRNELEPASNRLSSIAIAANLSWTIAKTGSLLGPKEYLSGDLIQHILSLGFAYAPGDKNGYYSDRRDLETKDQDAKYRALSIDKRKRNANALAFHGDYKPALILFNGKKELNSLRIDGIYEPARMINATMFSVLYRYENWSLGNFEAKLISAELNEDLPADVRTYYEGQQSVPIGFYGKNLGFELDASYTRGLTHDVDLGLALGLLLPGKAWKTEVSDKPVNSYDFQSFLAFKF